MVRTALASSAMIALLANSAAESRFCPEGKICYAQKGPETAATVQVSRWKGGYSCETAAELAEYQAQERALKFCEKENNVSCVQSTETEVTMKKSLLRCSATVKIAFQPLAKKTESFSSKPHSLTARSAETHLPSNAADILASFSPLGINPNFAPAILATAQAVAEEEQKAKQYPQSNTRVENEAAAVKQIAEEAKLAQKTNTTTPAKAAEGMGSAL
jgi:hypothetical protein